MGSGREDFESFQRAFWLVHDDQIRASLNAVMGDLELTPTPLSDHVKKKFMARVDEMPHCNIVPSLHGTDRSNLESIFEQGLLVGGDGVDIKHGAAYGRGVYTANLCAPALPLGFASHCEVLVCMVLNTPEVVAHRDALLVTSRWDVVPALLARGVKLACTATSCAVANTITVAALFDKAAMIRRDIEMLPVDDAEVFAAWRWLGHSIEQFCEAGYGCQSLYLAGFTAKELLVQGFSPHQVLRLGYSAAHLNKCGMLASALKHGGYSAAALLTGGYSAVQMRVAAFSARELCEAGYSLQSLKDAGFSLRDLKEAGCSAFRLKRELFSVSVCSLNDAGYSALELRVAGFTAMRMKKARYSAFTLKDAGYSACDLKSAGFTARQLRKASFTAKALMQAGFSAGALRDAGYTHSATRALEDGRASKEKTVTKSSVAAQQPINHSVDARQENDEARASISIPTKLGFTRRFARPVLHLDRPATSWKRVACRRCCVSNAELMASHMDVYSTADLAELGYTRKPAHRAVVAAASGRCVLAQKVVDGKNEIDVLHKGVGEDFGRVLCMLGDGWCDVQCNDGWRRRCRVCGRMRAPATCNTCNATHKSQFVKKRGGCNYKRRNISKGQKLKQRVPLSSLVRSGDVVLVACLADDRGSVIQTYGAQEEKTFKACTGLPDSPTSPVSCPDLDGWDWIDCGHWEN